MGMYDTVWVKCPKCGEDLDFQTKSGDCVLENYELDNAPDDVMENVNRHSPLECDCGCKYEIDIPNRKLVEVALQLTDGHLSRWDSALRLPIIELKMNNEQKADLLPSAHLRKTGCYKPLRVLNLYCGIGGNRKLWKNVEVTAVEYNEEIAGIYQEYFPNDKVVIADAHEYLLKHYKEFDFIWTSPPCPTHSRPRFWGSKGGTYDVKYPDWKLWQEILFLKHYSDCKFVVENVIPFYEGDIFLPATIELQRHLFWSNFAIRPFEFEREQVINTTKPTDTVFGFNISKYKIKHRKDQILRNLVNPELGLYIFEQAQGILRTEKLSQTSLF